MDQLKDYLRQAVKHQFWIVGGLLLLTATVVWYMGTGDLDTKFEADKKTNKAAFLSVSSLKSDTGTNSPPNDKYKLRVNEKNGELQDAVVVAQKLLYERQRDVFPINPRVGAM